MSHSRLIFHSNRNKGVLFLHLCKGARGDSYYCIYSDLINYSCPALQGKQLCCPLLRQKNWICNKLESLWSCFFDLDKENRRPSPKMIYLDVRSCFLICYCWERRIKNDSAMKRKIDFPPTPTHFLFKCGVFSCFLFYIIRIHVLLCFTLFILNANESVQLFTSQFTMARNLTITCTL